MHEDVVGHVDVDVDVGGVGKDELAVDLEGHTPLNEFKVLFWIIHVAALKIHFESRKEYKGHWPVTKAKPQVLKRRRPIRSAG